MIYLDNGATSFPKPQVVPQAMHDFMVNTGTNINRGVYPAAQEAGNIVYETRELLAELFNAKDPDNVVFTKNVTESLNVVLKGFLKPGDHIITSSMEHNAVMRPLNQLAEKNVAFSRVMCDDTGQLNPDDIIEHITPQTKAIVMTHASNVSGTILPLEEVGKIAREHELAFIVDAAQTAGVIPVDVEALGADALCFTGHKSLLGPQGTGGVVFSNGMHERVEPLLAGGTGSISDVEEQPTYMPDKFEPGTPNLPGIVGLNAALKWLKKTGISAIRKHECELVDYVLDRTDRLSQTVNVRAIGPRGSISRTGVCSLYFQDADMALLAYEAAREKQIAVRVGMHCAPSAHKTLGTYPAGTLRISVGYFNTKEEIDTLFDWLSGNSKLQITE